jgi:hypothetical protein
VILLGVGDTHPVVGHLKRRLGVYPSDDFFSEALADRVRGTQRMLGMEITGLIEDELMERIL